MVVLCEVLWTWWFSARSILLNSVSGLAGHFVRSVVRLTSVVGTFLVNTVVVLFTNALTMWSAKNLWSLPMMTGAPPTRKVMLIVRVTVVLEARLFIMTLSSGTPLIGEKKRTLTKLRGWAMFPVSLAIGRADAPEVRSELLVTNGLTLVQIPRPSDGLLKIVLTSRLVFPVLVGPLAVATCVSILLVVLWATPFWFMVPLSNPLSQVPFPRVDLSEMLPRTILTLECVSMQVTLVFTTFVFRTMTPPVAHPLKFLG